MHWDVDNFRFVIHELFLYAIAVLLRRERFESAATLLRSDYYVPGRSDYGRDVMVSFDVFSRHLKSLNHRNSRLTLNRISLRSDLLKSRCTGLPLDFRHVMQADLVLFVRRELYRKEFLRWWPNALLFASFSSYQGSFEIFARSRSRAYFDQVKALLDIEGKDELARLLQRLASTQQSIPTWD